MPERIYMITIFAQIKRLSCLFRVKPFDVSTEHGRSSERYRRAALTMLSAGLAKFATVLTLLVSVPLTLSYLGSERYGLWMTIGSVITLLSFSDLGIGNGLVNAISEANGKDDRELARQYVSSAFFMLTGVSSLLLIAFTIVYPWFPWQRLFNVHSAMAIAEAGPAMAVFFICFLVNIPLGIVNRIQVGYQEGFAYNLWTALGSLLALGVIVLACKLRAGLPWLVLAMTGTPVLATLLNAVVLFGAQRPWLLPSWRFSARDAGRKIFRVGMMFFVLQIAAAVGFSSDNIVIAQILGPDAVTQYSVPAKLFNVVTMLIVTILSPLWPAYGEALERREFGWIRKTLKRSIVLGLAIAVPSYAILLPFTNQVLHLWVGNNIAPPILLLSGLALWGVLNAIGNPLSYFLMGASVIKLQVVLATIMAITNIILSVFLTYHLGVSGPVWGTVISYSLISLLPCAIFIPKLLNSWSKSAEYSTPFVSEDS